eukprot:scaffold22531_cov98-Cylindrotheca_fusiformis.AAC.1
MPKVHYGNRQRGIASITGKLRRVPDKPYWEDCDDTSYNDDEWDGGKEASEKRKQTDVSGLAGNKVVPRSRRRKRARISDGFDSGEADKTANEKVEAKHDTDMPAFVTPAPTSVAPALPEWHTSELAEEQTQLEQQQQQQQQQKPSDVPEYARQVLQQLPKVERMLSTIQATLQSKEAPCCSCNKQFDTTRKSIDEAMQAQSAIHARNEATIQRLEKLCQHQAGLLQAATEKLSRIESSQKSEMQGMAQEIGKLKFAILSFETQQAANPVAKQQVETLQQLLAEGSERERLYCKRNMELSNANKRQESMILERDSRIQDYFVTSSRITELSNAVVQGQRKVQALEAENKKYKDRLESIQQSPSFPASSNAAKTNKHAPASLSVAQLGQQQQQEQTQRTEENPDKSRKSANTIPPQIRGAVKEEEVTVLSVSKKKSSRRKGSRKSKLCSVLPSFDSLAGGHPISAQDLRRGVKGHKTIITIDSP